MDKESKEQNLPTELNLHGPKKTYRAQTKGKFIEAIAQGNSDNYTKDKKWLHSANPKAAAAEN